MIDLGIALDVQSRYTILVRQIILDKEIKMSDEKAPKRKLKLPKNWTEEQYEKHLASLSMDKVPEGYLPMAEVCRKAREAGLKVSRLVTACGGDRAVVEIPDPVFKPVYVGGRKYLNPAVLTKGFELLKDESFNRKARKPREKKEGVEAKKEIPAVQKPNNPFARK